MPLWRRLVLLLTTLAWLVIEWFYGGQLWQIMALLLNGYVVVRYFIAFPQGDDSH